MRIAICDDNVTEAARVRSYLEKHFERSGFVGEIAVFDSGEALMKAFSPGAFDVLFLDIYMGGITGIDAARRIRETDPDCAIVFITVDQGHMPEGFALRAASYVLKPVTQEKMDTALLQCKRIFMKNARFIEVKSGRQNVKIPLPKIVFVETLRKSSFIHLYSGDVIKTYTPLEEIRQQLGGKPFLSCHRSFIVNMSFVEDILEKDFLMRGGDRVPIRKNGMSEVRRAVAEYFSESLFEE